MPSWLDALFGKSKAADRYVLHEAKTEQYRDEAMGGWRWARYERFSDCDDPKGELMRARHSKPVAQDTSFADASATSLAFKGDFVDLLVRGEKLEHLDLVNRAEGTRSGLSKWRLADGSLLTEEVRYGATA